DGWGDRVASRMDALLGEHVQFGERLPDEFPGPQSGIHQALDRAEFRDIVLRVLALGVVVALRTREAVAALPDAQHVLGQPGFALDGADVERAGGFHQYPS